MGFCRRFWCYAAQKVRPFFDVDMNGKKISGLPTSGYPTGDSEVSTKKYVDDQIDGDMEKATYDTEPNDVVDNAEKLEGSAKVEIQDHSVKEHALSSHSDPSNDVNMAGKKITHITDPSEDQDIATKKYADDAFAEVTPASIPLFGWGWRPSSDEATMRSQYSALKAIGMNSFLNTDTTLLDTWPDNPGTLTYYDRMFNVAAEMGIGIFFFSSMHRLPWLDPVYGQTVVERYKDFPALLGWMWADEPAARMPEPYPYDYNKWAYDWINTRDPNHYIYASWTHDLWRNWRDQYYAAAHKSETENWCKLGNVGSVNLYPWYAGGSGMPMMDFWLPYQVHTHNEGESPAGDDAFGDCGKGIIPTMEGRLDWGMTDTGIVDQYNKWKDAFANYGGLKGICLYPASHFLFPTGDDPDNLRGQIKDLARLLGWGG